MVWTCAKASLRSGHENGITDGSRWKAKLRQTKVGMARPGERGNQMTTEMAENIDVMNRAGTLLSVEAGW